MTATTGFTGNDPAKLAELLDLLEGDEQLLHPDGDLFGTTRLEYGDGVIRFGGNFWELSFAFEVITDDPDLIVRLDQAIEKQRAREAYARAAVENREHHRAWGYDAA